jgi:glucose/arabinose dehydrogenase
MLMALALALATTSARATLLDTNFTETPWLVAGSGVTGMAWAPDGSKRLFVTVKTGEVHVVANGVVLPTPFATLAPIYTASECGLIGMAFDPDFTTNGFVYFFVTVAAGEQQIVRYRALGNTGVEKTVIIPGLPTRGANHDGGGIGFGPDGKLYWSIGDNGAGVGVNDDLTLLAAKVSRANRDGSVPLDNPFVDGAGPNNDYVWARGFRNPYTLTFNPTTERLWVNTVGTLFEQVFTPVAGDHAGYIAYEDNQPAGFLKPAIVYVTNSVIARPVTATGAVRVDGTSTFITSVPHGFRPGQKLSITQVVDTSFNGDGYVTAVPAPDQFSIAQVGPDAGSGGGMATSTALGGCITGGTFWDSSAVPAAYRGNFFFGDFNSGFLVRAQLKNDAEVTAVDQWGLGIANAIDTSVGPDGDLYYMNYGGQIFRARFNASAQGLIVSELHLRLLNGGKRAFYVRLAQPVGAPVTVKLTFVAGDSDVSVSSGAALVFGPDDWSIPQPVMLSAARGVPNNGDEAVFEVAAPGATSQFVRARVTYESTTQGGGAGTGGIGGNAGEGGSGTGDAGDSAGGNSGEGGTGVGPGDAGAAGNTGTGGLGPEDGGVPEGGSSGEAGAGPGPSAPANDSGGCGCRVAGGSQPLPLAALALGLMLLRRRARGQRRDRN